MRDRLENLKTHLAIWNALNTNILTHVQGSLPLELIWWSSRGVRRPPKGLELINLIEKIEASIADTRISILAGICRYSQWST